MTIEQMRQDYISELENRCKTLEAVNRQLLGDVNYLRNKQVMTPRITMAAQQLQVCRSMIGKYQNEANEARQRNDTLGRLQATERIGNWNAEAASAERELVNAVMDYFYHGLTK